MKCTNDDNPATHGIYERESYTYMCCACFEALRVKMEDAGDE